MKLIFFLVAILASKNLVAALVIPNIITASINPSAQLAGKISTISATLSSPLESGLDVRVDLTYGFKKMACTLNLCSLQLGGPTKHGSYNFKVGIFDSNRNIIMGPAFTGTFTVIAPSPPLLISLDIPKNKIILNTHFILKIKAESVEKNFLPSTTVYWGDGVSSYITGGNASGNQFSHVYSKVGSYKWHAVAELDGVVGLKPLSGRIVVKNENLVTSSKYIKICNNGESAGQGICPQNPQAGIAINDWGCTKDLSSGLMWEIKNDLEDNLHSNKNTYSWYDPNKKSNGGYAGKKNGGFSCTGSECNTYAFAIAVNRENLCGKKDWRVPSIFELEGIVSNKGLTPSLDARFFPNTTGGRYLSSSTSTSKTLEVAGVFLNSDVLPNQFVWQVYFEDGFSEFTPKSKVLMDFIQYDHNYSLVENTSKNNENLNLSNLVRLVRGSYKERVIFDKIYEEIDTDGISKLDYDYSVDKKFYLKPGSFNLIPNVSLMWVNHSTIRVRFVNGTTLDQNIIFNVLADWGNFVSLKIENVTSNISDRTADIRIRIPEIGVVSQDIQNHSMIGKSSQKNGFTFEGDGIGEKGCDSSIMKPDFKSYCQATPLPFPDNINQLDNIMTSDYPSINYSWAYPATSNNNVLGNPITEAPQRRGTILHEFGHALGFSHEHFSRTSTIPWNIQFDGVGNLLRNNDGSFVSQNILTAIIAAYNNCDQDCVLHNFFDMDAQGNKNPKPNIENESPFDPYSLMMYEIVGSVSTGTLASQRTNITVGGVSFARGNQLSAMDGSWAQSVYPAAYEDGCYKNTSSTGDGVVYSVFKTDKKLCRSIIYSSTAYGPDLCGAINERSDNDFKLGLEFTGDCIEHHDEDCSVGCSYKFWMDWK